MNRRKYGILMLSIILVLSLMGGCSPKDSPQKKPQTTENRAKEPTAMKTMKSDIEKVNEELDKKIKQKREQTMQKQGSQQQTQGQSSQSSKSASQQGSGKSSQGNEKQSSKPEDKTSDYKNEQKIVTSLHQDWNNLEPEAIKSGLNSADRDEFEKALDELTKNIYDQKLEDSRLSAIAMYNAYAKLVALFAAKVPAGFDKVKYEAMTAAVLAENYNWDKAVEHLPSLQEQWDMLKGQNQQLDATLVMKTDFSVTDLKKAIESQDKNLVSIKADIFKKNLKDLEEKASSKM